MRSRKKPKPYKSKLPCQLAGGSHHYWVSPWRGIFTKRAERSCMYCGEDEPDGQ